MPIIFTCARCGKPFSVPPTRARHSNPQWCSMQCRYPNPKPDPIRGPRRSMLERFLASIDRTDTCWLWTAKIDDNGRARFGVRSSKYIYAHRFAYVLWKGPIVGDAYVLHSCDVGRCVNPAHLRLGTQQENVQDMIDRDRRRPARGEKVGTAKLTEAAVQHIRSVWRETPIEDLAEHYGVSVLCVTHVIARLTWKHVPDL